MITFKEYFENRLDEEYKKSAIQRLLGYDNYQVGNKMSTQELDFIIKQITEKEEPKEQKPVVKQLIGIYNSQGDGAVVKILEKIFSYLDKQIREQPVKDKLTKGVAISPNDPSRFAPKTPKTPKTLIPYQSSI
jgi:hypothetical protein